MIPREVGEVYLVVLIRAGVGKLAFPEVLW